MDTKIFIMSHKNYDFPSIPGYYTVLLGAYKNNISTNFDYYDNIGDNISDKNPNFCELTGIYWVWKNVDAHYVGICHYRRYFSLARFSNNSKYFLSIDKAEQILSTKDIILPKGYYCEKKMLQCIDRAPNLNDMKEVEKAIKLIYPDYLDSYNKFMMQNEMFLYNMLVIRKELYNNYCKWLFDILFYIEKNYDISHEDAYRSRLFGFLSERLLYVWIDKNISKNKIFEMRVVNTEISPIKALLSETKNQYRRWKYNKKYKNI